MNDDDELRTPAGLLALMGLPGIGPAKAIALARGDKPAGDLDNAALNHGLDAARREIDRYLESGVLTLGYFDDAFPASLRSIPAAPAVLYVRGAHAAWGHPSLTVVGTRSPTKSGETVTRALTMAATEAGLGIVSGLALGIDGVAHTAALDAKGRTVAVLGSGLDQITPRHHRELAERILDNGGALISEQPFDTKPEARTLVARNRLQSGLGLALLVGQTGVRGGTLHTVRFAAEQGRPVFCPVPREDAEENAGLAALLEAPAAELPALLPAWSSSQRLATRIGQEPLGRPVRAEDAASWIDVLKAIGAGEDPEPASEDGQMSLDGL